MGRDINRLFSMINQADLPYQVFEDDNWDTAVTVPSQPPVDAKPQLSEPVRPANEDVALGAHAGLFRAYNVEAALAPAQGTLLADIFNRMTSGR
ncbi:hypothetical protein [Caulobacter soli]|uniref:hypothetical protein n=1 Tax=Caulobacter soli TaxID=2708539 RepID=UPI0013EAC918|nr:hypothetical protein [Caulobacter soli]